MNLIVSVAIILLNLYVAYGISCQIPHVVLSIYFPDVSTSICVEADPRRMWTLSTLPHSWHPYRYAHEVPCARRTTVCCQEAPNNLCGGFPEVHRHRRANKRNGNGIRWKRLFQGMKPRRKENCPCPTSECKSHGHSRNFRLDSVEVYVKFLFLMSTTAFPCRKDTTFKRIIRISLTFDYKN